ncbi:VOC family protein [Variovorax sp. LjRoot84]|uniref:VOC family protein n=1 Tax=unclassified Variovorax TaxID=663243 RepID=UPI00088D111F|nr:VOC family protein [Variovorax sp. CF079]SDC81142.1 Glyoxalase superfamily enzyme, possibly 3-demethylubiquinone-9 3-methyltransferase [Variovorax sp. CF079]
MQKISPFLWFDGKAEEAAKFYTAIFKNSRITNVIPGPGGTVMGVSFELEGQEFMGLNGGPMFQFTPAVSFFIKCETQEEIDNYWTRLTEGGGEPQPCGWLKDKFGLSWQVIPNALGTMLQDKDPAKAQRTMEAMMKMSKLDIAALKKAYDGG